MSPPFYQTMPVPLYASIVIYYYLLAPRFRAEKQRAYLLSTLSASIMSCLSLPFFWTYITWGFEGMFRAGQEGWMGVLGEVGVLVFGVYLVADLSLGYLKYPSQIGLLTGWVHHTVYIALMIYCLYSGQSPIFLTCALMEIPTLDLALSNLFPSIRNDLRFLTSFFLIRILYNAVLFIDCLRPSSRAAVGGSWVPAASLFMAGCLHVSWFHGGVSGYLKRRKAHAHARSKTEVINTQEGLIPIDSPNLAPDTPEDSPLLTPRTPSITPLSLRDSYLPTLAIPHISLSSLPLPSFPTTDRNFGFKDAVKSRWEERRVVLGEVNLNLQAGAMSLRRRFGSGQEQEHEREREDLTDDNENEKVY